jgi:hypothetical protein
MSGSFIGTHQMDLSNGPGCGLEQNQKVNYVIAKAHWCHKLVVVCVSIWPSCKAYELFGFLLGPEYYLLATM